MPSSRSIRALAVALLAVLLGALLPAATAQAASRTVQGGRLDWGIKSSFQSYVTGPIAGGSWSLTGGAATVGGSQFRFHSGDRLLRPRHRRAHLRILRRRALHRPQEGRRQQRAGPH
ncbi:hypothetical protein SCALM49S_06124 [Streptomyces californicus]